MEDSFFTQQAKHSQQFLQHLNSIDPHIRFPTVPPSSNGSIPFLDTLVSPGPNNTLLASVHRKLTHVDQYLHWDSCHGLSANYSVFKTLTHRTKTVCTNQQLLKEEEEHIRKVLHRCKYPTWALNRLKIIINYK